MPTLVTLLLGLIGLGFLVFIHELGHYFAARKVGIKVESFSIGFGRPIVKWKRKGVEWRLGWLPFGGYVGMAGMDKRGDLQPYEVAGGFYNASPWKRIQVALAGPLVNIVFALFLFTLIWAGGGREKPFGDFTNRVGWVDPESELYAAGVRPGDIITAYDGRPVRGREDQLEAALLSAKPVEVSGFMVDYPTGQQTPFNVQVTPYAPPGQKEGIKFLGLLCPAQYLFVNKTDPFFTGSPLQNSALQPGDRLFWIDGELLFSRCQLESILQEGKALLTIERGGKTLLIRAPRVPIGELRPTSQFFDELSDWHFSSSLRGRLRHAQFIPYSVTDQGIVEGEIAIVDSDLRSRLFPQNPPPLEAPLQPGDRILAVDGRPVTDGEELLTALQTHKVTLIAQRLTQGWPLVSAKVANADFDKGVDWQALTTLIDSGQPQQAGNLIRLAPIEPVTVAQVAQEDPRVAQQLAMVERQIEKTKDQGDRAQQETALAQLGNQPILGVQLVDRPVRYNPPPTTLFAQVCSQVWRTVKSLVTGALSPKWLAGPIGIVQVVSYGWGVGVTEALFWLGVISLNLGILNLLPIPVLDGGHILFSVWEWITGRPIKAETRERWVIPFVVLLIGFFIFVTYHDISRLVRG
ncbi:MAG: site-2 protease family protein [Parachlamydiales bacterium]